MKKTSILTLINNSHTLTKNELIKKILVFVETEFEINISFLEYEALHPVLYYLDDNMILQLHQYKFLPEKSSKLEIIIDIAPFKENNYFDDNSVYAKIPIKLTDKEIGEIIFKIEDLDAFSKNKDLINKLSLEIAFLLDYFDLKTLKEEAIESLIQETLLVQKVESKLNNLQEEINILKYNTSDFGILLLDLELNIVETNNYTRNLLEINDTDKNISKFLSQSEVYSNNFINFLKKLTMENVNSVTNITLITNSGKELYLKVSGSILNERNHFFLKLFNLTSEIIITKKFANLKNKFDQLLKLETEDMIKTSDSVIIETLKFFENKDEDFGNHLERISEYSLIIAKDIFYNNSLNEDIDLDYINVLPRASALHDIGMLSIKESILFKDSKLTQEEFTIVKNHTIVAANMIDQLIKDYSNSTFLKLLKEITLGHHERYDGSGYPYKLEGKQIPLSARIVAFADIFDGLTTDRIYKKGLDLDIARMMIVDYKGKLIDPDIVEIYLKNEEKFIEIHKKYKNT